MKNAVIGGFLKVILISLAICSVLFCHFTGKYTLERTEEDMLYTLALMDYSLDYDNDLQIQAENINPFISSQNTRITILSSKGDVLADTSNAINYKENHIGREEIQKALAEGKGVSVRYSDTEKRNMLYTAYMSSDNDYILRLAIPYNGLKDFVKAIIPALFFSVIIAFIAAYITGRKLAGGITRPLSEISAELMKIQNGNETPQFKEYKYSELRNIILSIKILTRRIDTNIEKLRREKIKIDYILDNMSEGMLLIDGNKDVITINKAAKKILECSRRHKYKNIVHYTQNINIITGVDEVIEGKKDYIFDLVKKEKGKIYSVHIAGIKKGILDNTMSGAIILMIDVTSDREARRIRQDFFSNASHELKTPITSIQGYSELLLSNMEYSTEQKYEFINRIKTEAQKMTLLINDILMISRLETGTGSVNITDVDMKAIAEDIIKTTKPMSEENDISIKLECQDIHIKADYNQMYQLINNLVVNAIKYNNKGGNIYINMYKDNESFCFNIRDTGIGIPPQSQQRVFERFYRVDKGRSRKLGGTGLGLAIVKHIVGFYKGNIELKSKVGEGTEINIKIPMT